jgi:steroid delta-isomerase
MQEQFDGLGNAYAGAVEAGDAEAMSRLYTEDAILLTPGNPPIKGRQAIQEYWKEELGDGFKLMIKDLDIQELGDTAYAVGTYETEDEKGNWIDVVQRQEDGSLLLHRECWNVN